MVVIKRGLIDVYELEEQEKEKAEERIRAIAGTTATNVEQVESFFGIDWSLLSDFVLDLGLLADLGILESVGTLYNTPLSF